MSSTELSDASRLPAAPELAETLQATNTATTAVEIEAAIESEVATEVRAAPDGLQPDPPARPERRHLSLAVMLSLAVHTLLLSLTFSGQGPGLPGFGLPWEDRRIEVPDLRAVLLPAPEPVPAPVPAAEPLPATGAGQPVAAEPVMQVLVYSAPPSKVTTAAGTPKAKPKKVVKSKTVAAAPHTPPPANERVSPPVPNVDVITVAQSDESTWTAPPAPEVPTPVTAVAPSATSSEIALPLPRDAGDAKQDAQRQAERVEAERQETAQRAATQQEATRADAARVASEQRESAKQAAARQEMAQQEAARVESLRVEAERQEAAKQAAVRLEAARQEAARQEAAKVEAARVEAQRKEAAKQAEAARVEAERQEVARQAATRQAALRQEAARQEAVRADAARQEAARQEAARAEAARQDSVRQAAAQQEAARAEAARQEAARVEAGRQDAARAEAARAEAARAEGERQAAAQAATQAAAQNAALGAARQEAARLDAARQGLARVEAERLAAIQAEAEKREERLRAIGRQLNEEADRREAAAAAQRQLSPSASSMRRGRLFGHTDASAELIAYAEAWARKIQLNMTFDMVREAAKQPHANPLVTVAIRSDGSVEAVTFVRSSGVLAIDEAIRRIVQSQANYQAFPPGLLRDYDVVEIRRTWQFDMAIRLY